MLFSFQSIALAFTLVTSLSSNFNKGFLTNGFLMGKSGKFLMGPRMMSSLPPISSFKKWDVDLLYDSECPICMMEVKFLQKRDIDGKIKFTDISSPDYNPVDHGNVKFEDGMRKIRAVLPDNSVVIGVEVFRKTYEAIGLGWVFEVTNIPFIGRVADSLYDIWAENRLKITGRGDLADLLSERAMEIRNIGEVECNTDACGIDYDDI
eukprot:gene8961-18547_t